MEVTWLLARIADTSLITMNNMSIHLLSRCLTMLPCIRVRLTDRIVSQEIDKLEPEVRAEVIALIDSVKSEGLELTEKSVQNFMAYVRCPVCYGRVYRSNALLQDNRTNIFSGKSEPSNDTQDKTDGKQEDDNVEKKSR